jgi:hypothetical protein
MFLAYVYLLNQLWTFYVRLKWRDDLGPCFFLLSNGDDLALNLSALLAFAYLYVEMSWMSWFSQNISKKFLARLVNIPQLGDFLIFEIIGRFLPFGVSLLNFGVNTPSLEAIRSLHCHSSYRISLFESWYGFFVVSPLNDWSHGLLLLPPNNDVAWAEGKALALPCWPCPLPRWCIREQISRMGKERC